MENKMALLIFMGMLAAFGWLAWDEFTKPLIRVYIHEDASFTTMVAGNGLFDQEVECRNGKGVKHVIAYKDGYTRLPGVYHCEVVK